MESTISTKGPVCHPCGWDPIGLRFVTNILEKILPGCQLKQLPEINAVIYPECQTIGLFQKGFGEN